MVTEEKREREAEIRRPFALTITKEKMAATTVRNEGFFVRNRNAKKTKLELLEMVTDVIIAALRLSFKHRFILELPGNLYYQWLLKER